MKNFKYFVHRVSGLIENINTTNNFPEGGFYILETAYKFSETLRDGMNFVIIYDREGKIHTVLSK